MRFIPFLLTFLFSINLFSQGTQLLRQPSLYDNDVVFVYANDLWKANINGGTAIRLTSNEGYEMAPHFSNDGKMIAFTAEYDGNFDVYVIPSEGGEPKRLTYHPGFDAVQGWTNDGKVLFRSNRKARPTELNAFYTIGLSDPLPEPMDIPRGAYGEISQDGKYIAYTPITSWDPEWRNYRGGQAMPIWIVDLKTKELIVTPQPTKERHLDPVWIGDEIAYLSERDYASNIWTFNPKTKEERQLTQHKKFDVKSLDAHGKNIIYEQGGYLHLLNSENGESRQLAISIKGDMNFSRPRWEKVNTNSLSNPNISPSGQRAIFEYRGEIISIPKKEGSARNLTNSVGAADRSPVWSPKGDKIAWFSDTEGEYQLIIADQYGAVLKKYDLDNPTFYFQPEWSPDGAHIVYTDTHYNIWITNVESGKSIKVDTDGYAHPNRTMNPVWSPDSKWITYVKQNHSHFKSVFAYNIDAKEIIQLTDPIADAISPVWDVSGKYIYTLASTDYGLNSGWLDMSSYDPQVNRSLYAIVLSKKDKAPNLPQSDEEGKEGKDKDDKDQEEVVVEEEEHDEEVPDHTHEKPKDASKLAKTTIIDKNGIFDRVVALDLESRNYVGLVSGPENTVFVFESILNEEGLTMHKYHVSDKEKNEKTEFAKNISYASASADRNNLLINQKGGWSIIGTTAAPKPGDGRLNTNFEIKVDPQAEYSQIFKEGWRFMRDFLYVDNVHGAPWDEVYKWYAPWIKDVRHRTDLNYVVDIMSGEVAIGHSYVSGGDLPDVKSVNIGLLGIDFEIKNGYYQITKIYNGEQWNPNIKSPLGLAGLGIKEGDYILSVNGVDTDAKINPYSLFENTANTTARIGYNSKPSKSGIKTAVVEPVSSEYQLRTIDWVEANRKKVDELSGGKLAYVYVPNTSGSGFTSFNRYYFSQQDKKGVIIDERNNGGGSAADYMIDIMSRELFGYFNSKTTGNRPWTTPIAGIWGPKVMIINERAGSGGDLLPYMFKAKELGPLVGTRTWGGLVGTWDTPRFIDGGRMVAPRGGFYDVDGNWAVEGEGVAPDVEVIQDPKSVSEGKDPQLERAVDVAMDLLNNNEFKMKPEPAAPIRWKRPDGYKNDN